jgi:uncharacterized Tic20 family protein
MTTTNNKNIATILHLSALTQYFIPFGNYIFPIVIWSSKKDDSEFIDYNGKQVLNFQLSIFLYSIVLCLIAIPILIYAFFQNVPFDAIINDNNFTINNFQLESFSGIAIVGILAAFLFCVLKVIEFVYIILAAVKTSHGENYKYPLSIPFFK